MSEIQKQSKAEYHTEIYPLFAYRPSFYNGVHGIYATNFKPNTSIFIKKLFQEICLNEEWKSYGSNQMN